MKKVKQRLTSLLLSAAMLSSTLVSATPINVFAQSNGDKYEVSENYEVASVYTVSLTQDHRVKYSGVSGTSFTLKEGAYRSVYVKLTAEEQSQYYIEGVTVSPAGAADVSYRANTGEIFIENAKSDFTLVPRIIEKSVPAQLKVEWEFSEGGVYSENTPAATVKFRVTVLDEKGNPVPDSKLYYKADESEKSFTNSAKTDANGVATFKHAYAINAGEYEASFQALFSLDKDFSDGDLTESQAINVVLQKKKDLWLTTDRLKASPANQTKGGVIDVNPDYEYFTGALHQGAIDTASGEWVTPSDGNITNLAPGQYALRFRERVEGNTIYLHSDYAYFTIERAIWTVRAETSEGVSVSNDELYAAPGGEVFYYVNLEDGYTLSDYSVNKSSYIRDIYYNEEEGYIHITGITGSITLNVTAEKSAEVSIPVRLKKTPNVQSVNALELPSENSLPDATANAEAVLSAPLAASEEENAAIVVKEVNPNVAVDADGKNIEVKVGVYDSTGNPVTGLTANQISLVANSNYGSSRNRTGALLSSDGGVYTLAFTAAAIDTYGYVVTIEIGNTNTELDSKSVTLNIGYAGNSTRPTFIFTPEKNGEKNGTITIVSDYDHFTYYSSENSTRIPIDGTVSKVLEGIAGARTENGSSTGAKHYIAVRPYAIQSSEDTYTIIRSTTFTTIANSTKDANGNYLLSVSESNNEYYSIRFQNAAGQIISNRTYAANTTVGDIYIPQNTEGYQWPTVTAATGDVTYVEERTTTQQYTITFINAAGEVVSAEQYDEGTSANDVITPDNTENTDTHTYFWPEISDVTGNVTYTEQVTVVPKKYTVTFVNAAGQTVSEERYEEGTLGEQVILPENTPSTDTYIYAWPEISNVTGDVTYTEIGEDISDRITQTKLLELYQNRSDERVYISVGVNDNEGNLITDGITAEQLEVTLTKDGATSKVNLRAETSLSGNGVFTYSFSAGNPYA
ncbi:MAG: Ig-like domain-containing protein, partial [Clostridia bacterium]|nr:Ig-like domain-containing protein [Clostridia bacterium]